MWPHTRIYQLDDHRLVCIRSDKSQPWIVFRQSWLMPNVRPWVPSDRPFLRVWYLRSKMKWKPLMTFRQKWQRQASSPSVKRTWSLLYHCYSASARKRWFSSATNWTTDYAKPWTSPSHSSGTSHRTSTWTQTTWRMKTSLWCCKACATWHMWPVSHTSIINSGQVLSKR